MSFYVRVLFLVVFLFSDFCISSDEPSKKALILGKNSEFSVDLSDQLISSNLSVVSVETDIESLKESRFPSKFFTPFQHDIEKMSDIDKFIEKALNSGYLFDYVVYFIPVYNDQAGRPEVNVVKNAADALEYGFGPFTHLIKELSPNLNKNCRILAILPEENFENLRNMGAVNLQNDLIQAIVSQLNVEGPLQKALLTIIRSDANLETSRFLLGLKTFLVESENGDFLSANLKKLP